MHKALLDGKATGTARALRGKERVKTRSGGLRPVPSVAIARAVPSVATAIPVATVMQTVTTLVVLWVAARALMAAADAPPRGRNMGKVIIRTKVRAPARHLESMSTRIFAAQPRACHCSSSAQAAGILKPASEPAGDKVEKEKEAEKLSSGGNSAWDTAGNSGSAKDAPPPALGHSGDAKSPGSEGTSLHIGKAFSVNDSGKKSEGSGWGDSRANSKSGNAATDAADPAVQAGSGSIAGSEGKSSPAEQGSVVQVGDGVGGGSGDGPDAVEKAKSKSKTSSQPISDYVLENGGGKTLATSEGTSTTS